MRLVCRLTILCSRPTDSGVTVQVHTVRGVGYMLAEAKGARRAMSLQRQGDGSASAGAASAGVR